MSDRSSGSSALQIGAEAPDFSLRGFAANGESEWNLVDLRGTPVVLAFYPGDGTPVCTAQLNSYTAEIADFADVGAQLLAISPQSVESHRKFAESEGGFAFPLLADEDKAVAQAYGNVGPLGFYRRSIFVIDSAGKIGWIHRAIAGLRYKASSEISEIIAGLPKP